VADSVTLSYRPLVLEDLYPNSFTTLAQTNVTILGLGPSIPVTPVVSAQSDAAALATGLTYGDVYLYTGVTPIRLRAIGTTSSGASAYFANASLTPGSVLDGTAVSIGTIANPGVSLGVQAVAAGVAINIAGVRVVSKPASTGLIGLEVWNLSGSTQTLGSVAFHTEAISTSESAGSEINKLTSITTQTIGSSIPDGTVLELGTVAMPLAIPGMVVLVNTSPPLPTGVMAFGNVLATNTVELEVWNLSGASYSTGATFGMSIVVLSSGGVGASVNQLNGIYTVTIGSISDGLGVSVGAVGIPGCVPANVVSVEATTVLPLGVQAIGKVIATGMVGIELWNMSGGSYTPGNVTFNVTVLQWENYF
jgi:hypothetical protein